MGSDASLLKSFETQLHRAKDFALLNNKVRNQMRINENDDE